MTTEQNSYRHRVDYRRLRRKHWYERTGVRKTVGRLLIGTAGLLALYGAGLLIYLLFIKPDSGDHIKNALFHERHGDIPAAIFEAKQALLIEPDNSQARWLLSGYYLHQKDGVAAAEQIKRLKELGFASKDVEFRFLEALLLEDQYDDVLSRLAFVTGESDDSALHVLRGRARLGLGRTESALAAFEAALRVEPDNLQALLGVASAQIAASNYLLAETAIEKALALDPDHIGTLILRGRMLAGRGDYAGAEGALEKALSKKPSSDIALRLVLAEVLVQQKKMARAKEVVAPILERDKTNVQANLVLASASMYEREVSAAEEALLQALSEHSDHPASNLLFGEMMLLKGNLETAESHLARYLDAEPYGEKGLKLMAEIFLKRGRVSRAINLLEKVQDNSDDAGLLALLGGAYLQAGDYAKATAVLERAAELSPDSAWVHTRLAAGHVLSGNVEDGLDELKNLADLGPEYARVDYIRGFVYYRQGDYDKAIETATLLEERWPEEALHQMLKAAAYEQKGDKELALRLFEKALELEPENDVARYNLARIAWKSGDRQIARERFSAVLSRQPDHLLSLLSLAQLALEEREVDEATTYLERARVAHPQALRVRYLLASIYRQQYRPAQAVAVAREAATLAPDNPAVLLLLGRSQLETGNFVGATATLTRLARLTPESIEARLALAEAQRLTGNLGAASDVLEQASRDFADDSRVEAALGYLALAEDKPEDALAIAQALQKEHPKSPEGYLLSGKVHLASEDYQAAAKDFEAALQYHESPTTLLLLGNAQEKAAGTAKAVETYYRWLDSHSQDERVRIALAQALVRAGEPGFAIKELEQVHEQRPDDAKVVNNLAWLYGLTGRKEALALAKLGYELAPNDPEILDTYGWLMLQNDQVGEGLQMLERAVSLSSGDAEFRYHLAVGQARAGRADKARRELEAILELEQQDVDPGEVRKALENLQ